VPTPFKAIVARTRTQILAPLVQTGAIGPDLFFTDDELLAHALAGARDLWRALVDLHEEHYLKIDVTNVSYQNGKDRLTGVPPDVLRVLAIMPRDQSSTSNWRLLRFLPRKYTHTDFLNALALTALDATRPLDVYYAVVNAGSPVMAPDIYIAPPLSSDVPIRMVYVPTLPGDMNMDTMNPIPGESDHALMAWTAAYALGKQNGDGPFVPDTTWLAVYSTEKQAILTISEPRQEQQPRIVQGVFDELWGAGLSGDGRNRGWD
jgi:hypothetical protein